MSEPAPEQAEKSTATVQALLRQLLDIYDAKTLASQLMAHGEGHWSPAIIKRLITSERAGHRLSDGEFRYLQTLLPRPSAAHPHYAFRFIDLFAGIGGIRHGFEAIGGQCVFTSEWNKHAVRTYKANWYCDPDAHQFNADIRDVTLSHKSGVSDEEAAEHIRQNIPAHDVLLAGFPCQPFSLAGVSKKNALGRAHGFACDTQGTLFFDVARIIDARRPAIFVLENVKNLKSHDGGKTFRIIMQTLDELGYDVADSQDMGADDPKIIDGKYFLPQHRGEDKFRVDGGLQKIGDGRTARRIERRDIPQGKITFQVEIAAEPDQHNTFPVLWKYLYRYAKKHQAKGNGFGFGLVNPNDPHCVTRTLSARYYKDGAEILIDRGWDKALGEKDFDNPENQRHRPRRLTPRECARLMGFETPQGYSFRIPVSDTQAYRQFGNSVVVPAFAAVAKLLSSRIKQAVALRQSEAVNDGCAQ